MFAIIDLETTGGMAAHEKITEVAIYVHDGEKIVDEFTTLVNPERTIPNFITRLTGIDNDMVRHAPKFYEVAKKIVEITEGKTVVAHNAQFDYSFLREEFRSLGYTFSRDYLCTVKLSRKLIPGYRSYSLGNLCKSLGIRIEGRHRAAGDAAATVKLFEILLQRDQNDLLRKSIRSDYLNVRFPENFDRKIVEKLPESTGIYYLHNEDGTIIYIGKSNNIRKRVITHFANKGNHKAIEMRNAIRDVSFELTGNELIALLLESDEIKKFQPLFNRALRNTLFNYGIFQSVNKDGYITLKAGKILKTAQPIITSHSLDEAKEILESKISKFKLCQKLCGLYDIEYACFHHSINQCNGACIGKEPVEIYNERVLKAIDSLDYKHRNFLIVGSGRTEEERSVVTVENGKYLGFGFFNPDYVQQEAEILKDVISSKQDNRDVHRIIRRHLIQNKQDKILTY
ncbi:MAG: exonuclease domain-containing protein [Bacteroidetes bacterium]|nr:exonuclease domain-containing protein [Bacteroidota bacterium]